MLDITWIVDALFVDEDINFRTNIDDVSRNSSISIADFPKEKMKNLIRLKEEKLEELPKQTPGHRRIDFGKHWGIKYPSNKVIRFLHSNVGHLWNEVYSKYHALDWIPHGLRDLEHIKWHVIIDTFLRNGKVYYVGNYHSGELSIENEYRETFYVHPETKRLCVFQPKNYKKEQKKEDAKTMVILGDYHQLLKIEGIWYEVKGKPIRKDDDIVMIDGLAYKEANVQPVIRVVNGKVLEDIAPADGKKYKKHNGKLYVPTVKTLSRWHKTIGPKDRMVQDPTHRPSFYWRNVNRDYLKITLYRQLNSKELKKHGLRNDTNPLQMRCKKCGGLVRKDCIYHVCNTCGKYLGEDCKCGAW